MDFDLENPFTSSDDSITALFAAESDHCLVVGDGADLPIRRDAVALILQAQFSCGLDPFVTYLAINYVDRFLCKQEIPRGKPWVVRLLAVSCLSLASKMKRAGFCLADFQGDEGLIFDTQTIHRMELLVLGALDWRMRSITPFSFLRFFLGFFSPPQPHLLHALKSRASEIVFKAQSEINMLEFEPSLIAASALLSAAYELFPIQFPAFRSKISSCEFVNKERFFQCCNAIGEMAMGGCFDPTAEMVSSTDTPVTVFGLHSTSSESERTVGSTD
ncbi:cyclin-D6-1 [Typha angustifolia]|uniref:cyclin-D6-1 n=1 Tax=Typha angustifolia TaxID=59011 RepID=UPI003C303094